MVDEIDRITQRIRSNVFARGFVSEVDTLEKQYKESQIDRVQLLSRLRAIEKSYYERTHSGL